MAASHAFADAIVQATTAAAFAFGSGRLDLPGAKAQLRRDIQDRENLRPVIVTNDGKGKDAYQHQNQNQEREETAGEGEDGMRPEVRRQTSGLEAGQATRILTASKGLPCVVVQSTPSPWDLWDGVMRSEVVGWERGMEDWLFGTQDESTGRPMERVLAERCMALGRGGPESPLHAPLAHDSAARNPPDADGNSTAGGESQLHSPFVSHFSSLQIDPTRNAENDKVAFL